MAINFTDAPADQQQINPTDKGTFIFRNVNSVWRQTPGYVTIWRGSHSGATFTLALPPGYRRFTFKIKRLGVTAGAGGIVFIVSHDNGATWLTAAGSYAWLLLIAYNSAAGINNAGTGTYFQFTTSMEAAPGRPANYDLEIDPGSTTHLPNYICRGGNYQPSGLGQMVLHSYGYSSTAQRLTHMSFSLGTGGNWSADSLELLAAP